MSTSARRIRRRIRPRIPTRACPLAFSTIPHIPRIRVAVPCAIAQCRLVSICTFVPVKQVNGVPVAHAIAEPRHTPRARIGRRATLLPAEHRQKGLSPALLRQNLHFCTNKASKVSTAAILSCRRLDRAARRTSTCPPRLSQVRRPKSSPSCPLVGPRMRLAAYLRHLRCHTYEAR